MSIDKRNAEGYYDPTAYEALTLIEKEKHAPAHPGQLFTFALLMPVTLTGTSRPPGATVVLP